MARAEGKVITILSIDGGGIRGLIPAVILSALEAELQRIDSRPDARIADYFDIVAGTSTGSIIAAFLTAPCPNSNSNSNHRRPREARDIKDFYRKHSPRIFPKPIETGNSEIEPEESQQKEERHWRQHRKEFVQMVKAVGGHLWKRFLEDKYPLSEIGKIVDEELDQIQLAQTLTNVVIPAYDIQTHRLISFSSRQKREENSTLKLKDVVMGSAAAPTYFPPHEFEADGTKYSLVDGGLAANNPTLLAIEEATRMFGQPDCNNVYLILSLGTGTEGKDQNSLIGLRGPLPWLVDVWKPSSPLVELLLRVSSDMVDQYTASLLSVGGWNSKQNCFLRIQDHSLKNEQLKMDDTSKEHMDSLIDIGQKLLDKHVSYPSLGIDPNATNREALSRFARMLSDEKKKRERGSTSSSHVLSRFGFMTCSTICLLLLLFLYKLYIVFYQ